MYSCKSVTVVQYTINSSNCIVYTGEFFKSGHFWSPNNNTLVLLWYTVYCSHIVLYSYGIQYTVVIIIVLTLDSQ